MPLSPLTYVLRGDVVAAVLLLIAFVVAIAVHEGNHALVATALGDDTPKRAGRLSLNPLRHVDKTGLVFFVLAGFGWAWTPVNPNRLRPNPRVGNAIVAAAGPVANLLLALLCWFILKAYIESGGPAARFDNPTRFLELILGLNLLLFVFNLIPLPPLDGFTVLKGLLPENLAAAITPIEKYGMGLLFVLLLLPFLVGFDLVGTMFRFALGLLPKI